MASADDRRQFISFCALAPLTGWKEDWQFWLMWAIYTAGLWFGLGMPMGAVISNGGGLVGLLKNRRLDHPENLDFLDPSVVRPMSHTRARAFDAQVLWQQGGTALENKRYPSGTRAVVKIWWTGDGNMSIKHDRDNVVFSDGIVATPVALDGPLTAQQIADQLKAGLAGNPYLRGIVGIELISNMMTRWTKVFWVVWAVDRFDLVFIGSLLSLMFATSLCVKPLAGWLGSRITPRTVLSAGAVLLASGVVGLYHTQSAAGCLFWAVIAGIGDGLVMPSVMALIAYSVDSNHRGAAFGVLGSYRNIGKAAGPALGGLLVSTVGAPWTAVGAACLLTVFTGQLLWHPAERTTIDSPLDSAVVG